MIRSMTAFSRKQSKGDWGVLVWELRSVNHRYLESVFRLPESFRDIESLLREQLRELLWRGKLECQLKYQPEKMVTGGLEVNLVLATELNKAAHKINRLLDNPAHINAFDMLNWPGVLMTEAADTEPAKQQAIPLFRQALIELCEVRQREGERILPALTSRLARIDDIVAQIRHQLPELLAQQNKTLIARFAELRLEVDVARLEQEFAVLTQKADIAEELDRLSAHVDEVKSVLTKEQAVGRRLDFLMQELNREANTLASKSIATATTQFAVELKVLIEQMREQIQNIE